MLSGISRLAGVDKQLELPREWRRTRIRGDPFGRLGFSMSRAPVQRRDPRLSLVPRIKVWLETDGCYAFGFGLSEILQAVERAGSIKQAARDLGKSYRYVWGRIKEAEKVLGRQLVETKVGGKDTQRSSLTPTARRLVASFLALRRELMKVVDREFTRRLGSTARLRAARP
jgi:molybdate transport system regulatory protein